eukprot:GHUV01027258.1.p1 GENE.GHUV01027258.1~~GHUV01027258.1.p1  ORF type:complete len:592 (+),score=138.06 GHUV01027258.1:341-2116(+)
MQPVLRPQGDQSVLIFLFLQMFNAPPMAYIPTSSSSSTQQRFTLLDKQLLILLIPTLFDLLGSVLLNIGLLAVTASATAMLRQSLLLFAALLGVGLFKKKLNRLHLAGLAGCTAGLLMVCGGSLASGFGGSSATHRGTLAGGIALILASQMVAAGQLLIDQSVYVNRLQLSPLKVVGCQGLLGVVITVLLLLLLDASSIGSEGWGFSEDSLDSIIMIARSPLLLVLLLVYTGSLQAYNICGMAVSGELSAVDTTLLQAVRTLFVWIINLLIWAVAAALTPDTADHSQLSTNGHTSIRGMGVDSSNLIPLSLNVVLTDVGQIQQPQPQQQQWGWRDPAAAATASGLAAAAGGLPGEPWLRWSFLQAAGFIVLVLAALTYSRGDNERLRKQMEDEAALIMLDQPPSVAGSVTSNRIFTAHMDIDTAAYLRSFARRRDHEDMIYGITPVPSIRDGSGYGDGFRSARESREGLEPLLRAGVSGSGEVLVGESPGRGVEFSAERGLVLNLQSVFYGDEQNIPSPGAQQQQVLPSAVGSPDCSGGPHTAGTRSGSAVIMQSAALLPSPTGAGPRSAAAQSARSAAVEAGGTVELAPV